MRSSCGFVSRVICTKECLRKEGKLPHNAIRSILNLRILFFLVMVVNSNPTLLVSPCNLLRTWKYWGTGLALHQAGGCQDKKWDLVFYRRTELFFPTLSISGRFMVCKKICLILAVLFCVFDGKFVSFSTSTVKLLWAEILQSITDFDCLGSKTW